jgi:hypothetical protein
MSEDRSAAPRYTKRMSRQKDASSAQIPIPTPRPSRLAVLRLAYLAGVDPRTADRHLRGERIAGLAGERCRSALGTRALLTSDEAANALGISLLELDHARKAGIPSHEIAGALWWELDELRDWIAARQFDHREQAR